jgi:hypothetical protein
MISAGYTWFALFYAITVLLAIGKPAGPIAVIMRSKVCANWAESLIVFILFIKR